jgi:superoxide dismutase, Fe-Mn family
MMHTGSPCRMFPVIIFVMFMSLRQPNGGGKPTGKLAQLIDAKFGSYEKFREEFTTAALTAFGSGW